MMMMKMRNRYVSAISFIMFLLLFIVVAALGVEQETVNGEEQQLVVGDKQQQPPRRTRPTRRERLDLAKHIRACYKEVDLPKADAYKITRGNLERNDEKAQCFVKCVYMRVGVMNESGEVDEEKLKKILPKSVFEPAKVSEWIEACRSENQGPLCERAFKTYSCFLKLAFPEDPKNTIEKSKSNPFSIDYFGRT